MIIHSDSYPSRWATHGDLVLVDLLEDTKDHPVDAMDAPRRELELILAKRGSARLMIRVRAGNVPPAEWKREAMIQWIRNHSNHIKTVVFLEGEGFWNAAFRSLLSSLILLGNYRGHVSIAGGTIKKALDDFLGKEPYLDAAQRFFQVERSKITDRA
jgi:hypothetical protein